LSQREEDMKLEYERLYAEAQRQGYEAGFQSGLADVRANGLKQVENLQTSYVEALEEQKLAITDLALTVVKQIAGNVAPETWLLAQARTAVSRLSNPSTTVSLHVAPEQLKRVREELNTLLSAGDADAKKIDDVMEDEDLSNDQCQLHTPYGVINVDIDTQLASVAKVLTSPQSNKNDHHNGHHKNHQKNHQMYQ